MLRVEFFENNLSSVHKYGKKTMDLRHKAETEQVALEISLATSGDRDVVLRQLSRDRGVQTEINESGLESPSAAISDGARLEEAFKLVQKFKRG